MTHVVNNLCAFLMFEVVETAWEALREGVEKAECLDDIIAAHDSYLHLIHIRALLSPQHEQLNLQLQKMLQSILRFCALEDALVTDALAALARRRAETAAVEKRTAAGGWGVGSPDASSSSLHLHDSSSATATGQGAVDGVPVYVIQRLDEAAKEYGANFEALMRMLKDQGDHAEEILRFLTFRLDFNGFYSRTLGL